MLDGVEGVDELVAGLRARGWDPAKARRWLGFLARHLSATGRRDLAWWRLPEAVPRGRWAGTMTRPPGNNMHPCHLDLRLRGRVKPLLRSLRWSFSGMLVAVLPVAVLEVAQALVPELAGANASKVPGAVGVMALLVGTAMIAVGLVLAIYRWAQVPEPVEVTGSPRESLRRDLRMSMAQWLIFGAVLGVVGGLAAGVAAAVDEGEPLLLVPVLLVVGTLGFLVGVLFGVMLFQGGVTASARYLAAVRHLALRRRVPWRLMRFLGDARDAGLLIERGAVFRFRDRVTQDRLATEWAVSVKEPTRRRPTWR
jgi:hypothetical protein